ncbi:MAG: FHA domain-containing protein [Candidatus Dadabacteria bacterium]|nr:MAG: FHA domain-containing protein [Candidatus Dadabacteria bacterium]
MATDSTELTFIRCPSCRSLVPAVSKKCRMCGAKIGEESAEESTAEKKASKESRVRQRTMTGSQSELNQAVSDIREEEEGTTVTTGPLTEKEDFADVSADEEELWDEELEKLLQEEDLMELEEEEEEIEENPLEEFLSSAEEETTKEKEESNASASSVAVKAPEETPSTNGQKKAPAEVKKKVSLKKEKKEEKKLEKSSKPAVESKKKKKEPAKAKEVKEETAKTEDSSKETEVQNKLVGWLVSYKDPSGTSIELREGKFFVSKRKLKENDLLIDDSSISTPHALVRVSVNGGFTVQDLLSERGVFIRKKGEKTYKREDDLINVSHGDWIRFGDVEFLVALLTEVTK